MDKNVTAIYSIISPSGNIYIGQSVNIKSRFIYHKKPCNHIKRQFPLYRSFIKYGSKTHIFKIEYILPNDVPPETLTAYEQFFMDQYKEAGFVLLNAKEAGSKGAVSEKTKSILSIKNKGKKHSKETCEKMSKGHIGRKFSDEHKKKIGDANRKRVYSAETRLKLANAKRGTTHTPETRQKISNFNKGKSYPKTQEHIDNIRKSILNYYKMKKDAIA